MAQAAYQMKDKTMSTLGLVYILGGLVAKTAFDDMEICDIKNQFFSVGGKNATLLVQRGLIINKYHTANALVVNITDISLDDPVSAVLLLQIQHLIIRYS